MRELVVKYLSKGISRRSFVTGLTQAGLTMTAAQSVLSSVSTVSQAQVGPMPAAPAAGAGVPATVAGPVKSFQGPGGAAFAEQLIASGVNTFLAIRRARIPSSKRRRSDGRRPNYSSPRTEDGRAAGRG